MIDRSQPIFSDRIIIELIKPYGRIVMQAIVVTGEGIINFK
jgi:hypothetical protein